MGVNAQTTVPSFTASQILTAEQMNQSARTGVPVFADNAARDAAFNGAGEKTLAEGQLAYLEDSNAVQYYDGSSWATVGATAGGLVRLSGETAFSASSSVVLDSVFSATYRNYKIVVNYETSSTGNVQMRLRTGASSVSTTTYTQQQLLNEVTTVVAERLASQTSWRVGILTNGAFNSVFELTIFAPNIATPTVYLSNIVNNRSPYNGTGSGQGPLLYNIGGNQSDSTAFDGFELFPASGTMTGTYSVYGLATS